MNKGFTLVEVLVSVLIVIILVTMAVPMYERTVEKSRIAEVSVTLKRMSEAKLRTMDNKDMSVYDQSFGVGELDSSFGNTDDFSYSLYPEDFPNAVCAIRLRGDHVGTSFLYLGEVAPDYCDDSLSGVYNTDVCVAYRNEGRKMFCNGSCDGYSMDSYSGTGSCID